MRGYSIVRSLHAKLRIGATMFALAAAFVASAAIAGPYTRLQVLLPGETAAPGTATGKTGTPTAQTVGVPFNVTIRACDDTWTTVTTVTDAIQVLSSDASATLPATTQLASGTWTTTVTFNAGGSFTIFAHDLTDGTIPDGTSASVSSLALQGFVFSTISQKHYTAGVGENMTIRAVDAQGNTVAGYSGDVELKETTSFGDGNTVPAVVTLTNGVWSGQLAALRADETNINRGNVNFYAWLPSAPGKNGTSDPFVVHPGPFSRLQVLVPGESPLPGSPSGKTGQPASQGAGHLFTASVWATDAYWNPVYSGDNVRLSSSDGAANTPLTATLSNGAYQFNVTLGTVGTQTLTISDVTNPGITSMTTPGITVLPNSVDHFVISTVSTPQVAGAPVAVTISAADANGNTVPNYAGDVNLAANTGAGSMSPERVTLASGTWSGNLTFRGAGGAVTFTATDFAAPPHTGSSNSFTVSPGPLAGLQVLLPGETAAGGTPTGKVGTPTGQSAGTPFTVTLRAVDAYWNLVPGVTDTVALGSTDQFAVMSAETTLANGQRLVSANLHRSGPQRIWVSDVVNGSVAPDTSAWVNITGGTFSKVLVLAPGESPAPGTASGRTGTATDQSINYAFTVTVLATDQWWNPVNGVSDVVRIGSDDPMATLPPDTPLVDGRAELSVRLARGGYDQISVADVTNPTIGGSSTQVRAISSGFHLEAAITESTARAGEPFTLTVKVTNDAGSVIQEINSFVTLEVQQASTRAPGKGTMLTTQFQLLQGQRILSETYSFAEPIVVIARDDAGNAPATSNAILITPGQPAAIQFTSSPPWVGGNKHAVLQARLVDAFDNGVPGEPVTFARLTGAGTVTPIDSLSDSTGVARADFLSPRQPEKDLLRAAAAGLTADLLLETAFVDPTAPGGTVTNYPNPFHPGEQPTTLAWKLEDNATVHLRIFTQSGDLVYERTFGSGSTGGSAGLNEFVWDGRNGAGHFVASGGYIAFIEAQGQGATLHVMRRKIAAVR